MSARKIGITAGIIIYLIIPISVFAQDGSSPGYWDDSGWHEDQIWNQRRQEERQQRSQDLSNMLQNSFESAQQHQRDLQRIQAEQATERQRIQNEQWAQQEQLRIQQEKAAAELRLQQEQAELANEKNYKVTVYGTTLWKTNEPSGIKDRTEVFTLVATSSSKAEAKGIELFKAKWKGYLIDDPNIWAQVEAK